MTNTSQLSELNIRLLVLKDELRRVESAISDAEANATNPGIYYTKEQWHSLAADLRQDAADLVRQIELFETRRQSLLNQK